MRKQLTQMRAPNRHLLLPPPEIATQKDEGLERTNPAYIRWMQNALNRTMKTNLVPTGTLGLRTRQAIRAFQRKEGLPENGLTSFCTEKRLIERCDTQPPREKGTGPHEEEFEAIGSDILNNRRTAMNRQILYGTDFEFSPQPETGMWHWEYNPLASGGGVDQEWGWSSIANWFTPSTSTASPTTTYAPSVSSASYAVPTSRGASIRNNAVAIANAEWNRWRQGSIKESDPNMRSVLEDYWLTGTGSKRFEINWWAAVPWSAAFISWVMKKAGAGQDFSYSASHSVYTAAAKENALQNNTNLFKAYRITEVAPRLGDIVCKDRGSGATYDNIKPGMSTHCDIVVSVQPNSIAVIGGNLSDSVSKNTVSTDSSGKINAKDYFAVIRVGTS